MTLYKNVKIKHTSTDLHILEMIRKFHKSPIKFRAVTIDFNTYFEGIYKSL